MQEGKNIFSYLNAIYFKTELKYNSKLCPSYLLSLWLSHDKTLLPIIAKLNKLQFVLPDEAIYQYYWHNVPPGKRFIKWTKKIQSEEEINFIKEIKENYCISTAEAKMFKKLFTK